MMMGIEEDSVRIAHSGPSHNLLRPAFAELVSCGPHPLHMSAGGHASSIPIIISLDLLHEEGLISLDVQYIDGTKIESVANKYTFVWKGSVEKNKAKLIAKVGGVLKEAEAVLEEENAGEPQEVCRSSSKNQREICSEHDNGSRRTINKGRCVVVGMKSQIFVDSCGSECELCQNSCF